MPPDDRRSDPTIPAGAARGGRGAAPTELQPATPRARRGPAPPTIPDFRLRGGPPPPDRAEPPRRSADERAEPSRRPAEHEFGSRYEWIEDLGRGGFGTVCKAYDNDLREYVAIKTIKTDDIPVGERSVFLEKFKDEARNARELSHPNIVRVYSYERIGDQPFIVMALVDGGTLSQLLDERATLNADEVCEIGIQIADALDYVHRQRILHRDIKPSNIFTPSEGGYKLGDFGIARRRKPGAAATHSIFQTAGTPYYMSPEQWATPSRIDGRSDLFSLCVVLYEALTGKRPYDVPDIDFHPEESRQSSERARRKVRQKFSSFTPIASLAPEVPPPIAAVIERGLVLDREQRYATCGEFARALEAARAQRPGRNWLKIAAVAAMTLVVLATTVFAGPRGYAFVASLFGNGGDGGDSDRVTSTPGGVQGLVGSKTSPTATPTITPQPTPTADAGYESALQDAEAAHGRAKAVHDQANGLRGLSRAQSTQLNSAEANYQTAEYKLDLGRQSRHVADLREAQRLFEQTAADFTALLAPAANAAIETRPERTATVTRTPIPPTMTATERRGTPTVPATSTATQRPVTPTASATSTMTATERRATATAAVTSTTTAAVTRTSTRPPADTATVASTATAAMTRTSTHPPAATATAGHTRTVTATHVATSTRPASPTQPPRTLTPTLRPTQPPRPQPVITGSLQLSPNPPQEGKAATVSAAASDPQGDPVTCEWTVDGVPVASVPPCAGQWSSPTTGQHSVRVTVRNAHGGEVSRGWQVTVLASQPAPPPNQPVPPVPPGNQPVPPANQPAPPGSCTKTVQELATDWLGRERARIEANYKSAGEPGATSSLSIVSIDGGPPTFTVTYTRVDEGLRGGSQPAMTKKKTVTCQGCSCQ